MRRFPIVGSFLLASWSVLALAGESRGSKEPEKGESAKYSVRSHQNGKEIEKTFDIANPKDAEELDELLKKGEVEELARVKAPDILGIYWDLGLWTVVVFVLLYLVLRRLAWGPMLEGLKRREGSIRGAIEDAQKARDEAEKLRAQFQQQMDRVQETVREIHDEARRKAQQAADEMLARTRAEIQSERDRLRREIDTARDQALQELWSQTAQLATLVSAKAIRRQVTPEDHRRLVDEALAELRGAGSERQRQVMGIRA
jgi:F-type H+-transporting ATPase subunit b